MDASETNPPPAPIQPLVGTTPLINNQNPASTLALPAESSPGQLPTDASTTRKFYTISASLREIYDDNVNTTSTDQISSLETQISPSILVDFPGTNYDFSAGYTFNLTYYSDYGNAGSNYNSSNVNNINDGSSIQYSHEFDALYTHAFSDRFKLTLAEDFRYTPEPSVFESTGTFYQNGNYSTNQFNAVLTCQWTPLFSTTSSFANTLVRYDDSAVAQSQDSVENTGTQSFSFAILPKISVNFGGIVDEIDYDGVDRGYANYTLFVGSVWQALPTLNVSGQAGASYTEQNQASTEISPYAALSVNWTLGARSSLAFNYAHEVTPTDQQNANAQTSDRVTGVFNYSINPRLSTHLQGICTNANISQEFINSSVSNIDAYSEIQYALDTGLAYHWDRYFDFDAGVTLTGVSSDSTYAQVYTRTQTYVGIRGTY